MKVRAKCDGLQVRAVDQMNQATPVQDQHLRLEDESQQVQNKVKVCTCGEEDVEMGDLEASGDERENCVEGAPI